MELTRIVFHKQHLQHLAFPDAAFTLCGQQINDDTQRHHRNFVGLLLCETCRSERAYRSKKVGKAEQYVWLAEYLVSKYPLTAKQMVLILRVRDASL